MEAARTIKVFPIYGWGWVIAGSLRFEVPGPFTVQLEHAAATRWSGVVLDSGHEFEGQQVELSQRHMSWTGDVNIVVQPREPDDQASSGFGTLAGLPSTEEA